MPELPEVETTVRGIAPTLLATRCQEVLVRQAQLRWPISPALSKQFSGQTIISITRRAKYILLQTINGTAIIHLGMSG